jgi:hypothetical protein
MSLGKAHLTPSPLDGEGWGGGVKENYHDKHHARWLHNLLRTSPLPNPPHRGEGVVFHARFDSDRGRSLKAGLISVRFQWEQADLRIPFGARTDLQVRPRNGAAKDARTDLEIRPTGLRG